MDWLWHDSILCLISLWRALSFFHPFPLSLKNPIGLSTPVMNTLRTARLEHGTDSSYIYLSSGGRAPFRQLHPFCPIYQTMGCNPIYDSGLGKDALVCDIVVQGSWQWPEANSPFLITLKIACLSFLTHMRIGDTLLNG